MEAWCQGDRDGQLSSGSEQHQAHFIRKSNENTENGPLSHLPRIPEVGPVIVTGQHLFP